MDNLRVRKIDLHKWINCVWYGRSAVSVFLLPFSVLFFIGSVIRKSFYNCIPGLQYNFMVPVIVVGNLTIGGTGKTPMVIYLARQLTKLGYHPGVASRGYGVDLKSAISLQASHSATEVGDEPCLIYKNTEAPVVVGPDRKEVINQLISHNNCNVVICDDGLQDYRFVHDIEILMVDGDRQFGNRKLLPAGPLRERIQRGRRCDFIVATASQVPEISSDWMELEADRLVNLHNLEIQMDLAKLAGQKVHAVAGIGNPQRFFNYLLKYGLVVIKHSFPDHARYSPVDFEFRDEYPILMTEKDAVKCTGFELKNAWYLPVVAKLPGSFMPRVETLLRGLNG